MRALFLFHLGAGVRMAARSSAIVVAAIPAMITLQEAPAAVGRSATLHRAQRMAAPSPRR